MLVGIFIAQYCISSITWFFVSWFPSYLVKARGLSVMEASLVATVPAIAGFVGGVSTGFFSDWLLKKTGSLSIARKLPITVGLGMSALIIGCNYTNSSLIVVFLMSAAFFGKGFGSLGWTVVADTAPKEIVGLTGGVFNALGNTAGIVTPVMIGYILANTGSFNGALTYVGLHGLVAVLCYWVIVGPIQRVTIRERPPLHHAAAAPAE
ncbi:MFS transporter [Bradyrhizobium manausense]|uniref:MFS transporter n=1 Tax=Bradyrhizobium manausense TaxID=989370 RepID=UPI0020125AE0|nr:MFS transporter [Bradyrhizobium manausense]